MLWLLVSSLVKSFLTAFFALCSLLHFSWLLVLPPNSFFTPLFTSYRFSSFTFLVYLFSPIPSSSSISSSSTFCFPSSPFFYCALFFFSPLLILSHSHISFIRHIFFFTCSLFHFPSFTSSSQMSSFAFLLLITSLTFCLFFSKCPFSALPFHLSHFLPSLSPSSFP